MTAEQIAACPECGGAGYHEWMEVVCCGNCLPSGECCSMPVGDHSQVPCEHCNGSGRILQETTDA